MSVYERAAVQAGRLHMILMAKSALGDTPDLRANAGYDGVDDG